MPRGRTPIDKETILAKYNIAVQAPVEVQAKMKQLKLKLKLKQLKQKILKS